ncbi:MAG: hypothetical protein GY751_23695, partial [Bacteroidetes bacterium]|nr:hypothetical protein [Bacteroidota bacterium]
RIKADGNVGIGEDDPSATLDVVGSLQLDLAGTEVDGNVLVTDASGNASWSDDASLNTIKLIDPENSNAIVELRGSDATYPDKGVTLRTLLNPASGESIFRVLSSGGAERLRVEHDGAVNMVNNLEVDGTGTSYILGNVGIGTTSPFSNTRLTVNNNSGVSGARVQITGTDAVNATWRLATPSTHVIGFGGNSDHNVDIGYFDSGNTTFTTRMRVEATTGNVGIGTTSPGGKLHIANSATDYADFAFSGSGMGQLQFVGWSSGWNINAKSTGKHLYLNRDADNTSDVYIGTNGEELFVEGGTGNVGIGTTSPAAKLHVDGGTNTEVRVVSDDGGASTLNLYGSSQGTGRVFVGQSASYGGGIEYNGDNSPTTTGAGADYITLWRRNNNADHWTARNKYSSNDWQFREDVDVQGYLTVGDPTTGSTTRQGHKVFFEGGNTRKCSGTTDYDFDYHMGQLTLPSGASSFKVKHIAFTMKAYHEEGDENFHVKLDINGNVGGTSWSGGGSFGLSGNHKWMNWTYGANVDWNFTSNQTVKWEFYEENDDCWGCDNECTEVRNVKADVIYNYSKALVSGEIAAAGRIYANNTYEVGDMAEYFPVNGDYEVGDIISFIPGEDNTYARSSSKYDQFMTGVVSENPSVVLNNPDVGPPVALTGRVKVNIAPGHPPVKSGDRLTSSPIPGKAMKANEFGHSIGYAVTNQVPGENWVEIMVQPGSYYIPPKTSGGNHFEHISSEKVDN